MNSDLTPAPHERPTEHTFPCGAHTLKVILKPAEVLARISGNTDPPGPSAPDPKKPFFGHVTGDEFRIRSKRLDRPRSPSPLLVGRVCPCADGCELIFGTKDSARILGGEIILAALWGYVAGAAISFFVAADPESGRGYLLFSGIFVVGALALWLSGQEDREKFTVELVALFEAEAFRRELPRLKRPRRLSRLEEVTSTMLSPFKPPLAQRRRALRTRFVIGSLVVGVPLLVSFLHGWSALRRFNAEFEALRSLQADDLETVAIYRDRNDERPLVVVADPAQLRELCDPFGRAVRWFRGSDYSTRFFVVIRYRDGTCQNWEVGLKGASDDGLYMSHPAGEELSSFRLSSDYYRVPQLRGWLENVTAQSR